MGACGSLRGGSSLHLLLRLTTILRVLCALAIGRLATLIATLLVGAIAVAIAVAIAAVTTIATLLIAAVTRFTTAISALTTTIATLVAVATGWVALARTLGRLGDRSHWLDTTEDPLQPTDHAGDRRRKWQSDDRSRGRCCSDRGRGLLTHRSWLARLDRSHCRRCRNVQLRLGQRMHRQLARRTTLIARLAAVFAQLVLTQTRDFVMQVCSCSSATMMIGEA